MKSPGVSIKRKIVVVMMTTTITVLAFTIVVFMFYEIFMLRDTAARNLSTQAKNVANRSSGALAFKNKKDAREVLSSLRADAQILAAALYDNDGKIFVTYPENTTERFPAQTGNRNRVFRPNELILFEPVFQENARQG